MKHSFKESERYANAVALIDAENLQDPRRESDGEAQHPFELLYARRVLDWIQRLAPDASEPLLLAGRSQHICRWMIPREQFPMDLKGYLEWRETLKEFHAGKAEEILKKAGYPAAFIARVRGLITKDLFPDDPESRVLEDALCLVFLAAQLAPMMKVQSTEKLKDIIAKMWAKMTPQARRRALELELDESCRALILSAVGGPDTTSFPPP